jgi:hypothetical protein
VGAIESGKTKSPSLPVGVRMARTLNISAWEIAFGKPEPRRFPLIKKDPDDLLAAALARMESLPMQAETEKHEDRLMRLEHSVAVHNATLHLLLHAALATDRIPDVLQRLALLIPGSETLAEELRALRVSA